VSPKLIPFALLAVLMFAGFSLAEEPTRKVTAKTAPSYPEMAKKMHLTGKVKVEVVITASGSVKSAKLVGGSPVFETSALEAAKQWRFEAADKETTTVVLLEFTDH
jgi:TonB family protein